MRLHFTVSQTWTESVTLTLFITRCFCFTVLIYSLLTSCTLLRRKVFQYETQATYE